MVEEVSREGENKEPAVRPPGQDQICLRRGRQRKKVSETGKAVSGQTRESRDSEGWW